MLYATLSLTQYSHQIFDTFVHRNYSICYVFSVMCSFCRPQFNAYACMYRYVNKMYSNGLDHGRVMTRSAKMHTHTQSTSAKSIQNALNTSDVLILGAVFMAQNRLFSICWLDIEGSRRRKVEGEYSLPWLFLSICRYVCTLNA